MNVVRIIRFKVLSILMNLHYLFPEFKIPSAVLHKSVLELELKNPSWN